MTEREKLEKEAENGNAEALDNLGRYILSNPCEIDTIEKGDAK